MTQPTIDSTRALRALIAGLAAVCTVVPFRGATAQTATRPACATTEHRQFDFWIGDWTVTTPQGSVAGTNRIERALDGCALLEHWTGARGGRGTSINYYDASARAWFQTWIDNTGQPLRLRGGRQGASMVLEAEGADSGRVVAHRITWTPLAEGRIRQHWERSSDGRRTWATVFDGLYSRRDEGGVKKED